ncbi:hypothetical protein BKA70DRAFT_1556835 [Coprinopsis sp. MPI-PUGE-AT-0042]|nr:hypothetical protein BKA70DRAFT_1556835 [Coprinopsis sp. MPI-PUGE-AT-0042]
MNPQLASSGATNPVLPLSEPPILRLPPELTSSIMELALGDPKGLLGKCDRRQFLRLRMVCRQWREAAFSTPDLWRKLDVNIENPHEVFLRKLHGWFSQAGHEAGLHLALRRLPGYSSYGEIQAPTIISLLNQYRFEYLHLGSTITKLIMMQKVPIEAYTFAVQDILRFLSLMLYNDPSLYPKHGQFISQLFQSYPRLESLALNFHHGSFAAKPFLRFPRRHLRSLLLYEVSVTIQALTDVLVSLPELEELVLWYITSNRAYEPDICLPSLRHLLIHPDAPQTLLLQLLTCPSLTLVEITGYKDHPPEVMQENALALAGMIRRSEVQYENFKLALGKHVFQNWTAAGILLKLPLLQHLQISTVTTDVPIASPSFGWPTSLKSMTFRETPSMDVLVSWLRVLRPILETREFRFTIYIARDPVDGDTSADEAHRLLRTWGMKLRLLPQVTLDAMGYSDAAIINHEYRNANWQ